MNNLLLSIETVSTIEACRVVERLQQEIWGCDSAEVVPDHMLLTFAKEGGQVLLAHTPQGLPVGFGFAFPGLTSTGHLKLASHQVGVLPQYQDSGLGYQIKLAQREEALARNINLITWTFDPIQGRNARFNLHKLGAVANTHYRELYGQMRDELNQGLPTDRLRADWWLDSDRVRQRLAQPVADLWPVDCPVVNPVKIQADGLPVLSATIELPPASCCLVEMPGNIQQLKNRAPHIALQWRLQSRQIFEQAFARGYTAVDFLRKNDCNYYLLQKDWTLEKV